MTEQTPKFVERG